MKIYAVRNLMDRCVIVITGRAGCEYMRVGTDDTWQACGRKDAAKFLMRSYRRTGSIIMVKQNDLLLDPKT